MLMINLLCKECGKEYMQYQDKVVFFRWGGDFGFAHICNHYRSEELVWSKIYPVERFFYDYSDREEMCITRSIDFLSMIETGKLNNLYYVVSADGNRIKFKFNGIQFEMYRNLDWRIRNA